MDNHYVLTAIPGAAPSDNLGKSYTVVTAALPGSWALNAADSRWITTPGTPSTGGGANGGNAHRVSGAFDYTLTFNLPAGAILSTVSITGSGWADDSSSIVVNGVLVSGQSIVSHKDAASSFTLNNANATFVSGANTLTFRVNNAAGATGLFINSLSGTVTVPEVGAMLPIFGAIALYGVVLRRRKKPGENPHDGRPLPPQQC